MIFEEIRKILEFRNDSVYWMMNVNQEQYWNEASYFPSVTDPQRLKLVKQQEQQLLFIADANENVIFSHNPDEQFLHYLVHQRVSLPQIVLSTTNSESGYSYLNNSLLIPYIYSEDIQMLIDSGKNIEIYSGSNLKLTKELNNKFIVRNILQNKGFNLTRGFFCQTVDELKDAYSTIRSESFEKCVLKIPYGSSGKGLQIIENEQAFRNIVSFIGKRAEKFELLIEGWHNMSSSINSQVLIQDDGAHLLAITEQIIDDKGVYLGTNFTPKYDDKILSDYIYMIEEVGELIHKTGYRGIVGIDSIIETNGRIIPVIEINARFTQVTYLLPIISEKVNVYPYIESMYLDFTSKVKFNFNQIIEKFDELLQPDEEKNYLIYTFANVENEGTHYYRIFILFFTKSESMKEKMRVSVVRNMFD